MAQELLSGANLEMWLPSELLGDDLFLEEKMYRRRAQALEGSSSSSLTAPFCFPHDCESSSLSSSPESEESDEEDHLHNSGVVSGLTHQMARSLFLDRLSPSLPPPAHAAFEGSSSCLACSPQSPLCSDGMWSGWSRELSAKGGVRVPSQLSSPPTHQEPQPDNAWEMLYAAAAQVRRMCLSDEVELHKRAAAAAAGGCALLGHGHGLPRKLSPPRKEARPPSGYYCYDGARQHHHHGFPLNQLQQLKKQQQQQHLSAFWSRQNRIRASMGLGIPSGVLHPPVVSRSTWPPVAAQQPPPHPSVPCGGSGMRAVFLGGNRVRKQSSGTGVFLPRRVGSPAEPRKKPACSTVLVPAKVVQALDLNLEDVCARPHPRHPGGAFFVDPDTCSGPSAVAMMMKQKRGTPPAPPVKPQLAINQEMRLPPEWTY